MLETILTILVSLLVAISGFIITWFNVKTNKIKHDAELQSVKDAVEYIKKDPVKAYLLCKKCGEKNYIDDSSIHFEIDEVK